MSKQHTSFLCSSCNYKTIRWLGCCPSCSSFDTFKEQKIEPVQHKTLQKSLHAFAGSDKIPIPIHLVQTEEKKRILSGISEWDRVIGGGFVPGSLLVLTGDPGIGKSTLLLQISHALARQHKILYISTEESAAQIKQRAERIGALQENLSLFDETSFSAILSVIATASISFLVIDSLQSCYIEQADTAPGSISQLKIMLFELMKLCKSRGITAIITSHITKDGIIAGPKTLEHMVDAVFYLQGDDQWDTRLLLGVKNRFGSLHELGFFRMESGGLKEIPNINQDVINAHLPTPGSVLVSTTESSRPLLFELQALTIESRLALPQRIISGVEHKQVVLIAAILEKYIKIRLSLHDIFFKVSGGFRTKSNAIDLGIAFALLSSYFQKPLPNKLLACGEMSLTGHVKAIPKLTPFLKDAHKFGIEELVVSKQQQIKKDHIPLFELTHIIEIVSFFN
jgi:DNA repair protein RadA/Sms